MLHIERETNLHLTYCEGFGLSREQMVATEERMACTAYTRCARPPAHRQPGRPNLFTPPHPPPSASPWRTTADWWHRYVLDVGQSEDWLALQVALAPCLLGYGALAKMLHGDARTKRDGNRYWTWIENYVADDYVQAVRTGSGELYYHSSAHSTRSLYTTTRCALLTGEGRHAEVLERHAVLQSASRIEELIQIFIHATKVRLTGRIMKQPDGSSR